VDIYLLFLIYFSNELLFGGYRNIAYPYGQISIVSNLNSKILMGCLIPDTLCPVTLTLFGIAFQASLYVVGKAATVGFF